VANGRLFCKTTEIVFGRQSKKISMLNHRYQDGVNKVLLVWYRITTVIEKISFSIFIYGTYRAAIRVKKKGKKVNEAKKLTPIVFTPPVTMDATKTPILRL
jgi:hypothetical protein